MGFLKNFFTDVYANETKARPATGFQQLSETELEAHLNVCRYGDFELKVRQMPTISPREGLPMLVHARTPSAREDLRLAV